jgi:para-nitrobenzyl esterase
MLFSFSQRLVGVVVLFLAGVAALSAQPSVYPPSPKARVTTAEGVLQGAEPAPGLLAFLGIPYAQPPVGELRWRPPQPFPAWSSERQAVRHGNPCPQQNQGWNQWAHEHGSEDCLYLNVWAPAGAHNLPVLFYIHGGSNTAGSAVEDLSSGFMLVPHGIVLVTIDYRLGIFGFFRSAELDGESAQHASGDYGLLDQIAALQWVQRNIAAFGGDPKKVTIIGQSAGAVDVGLMVASPLARGLFRGAISESGQVLGLMPTATREESENAWQPVARAIGADLKAQRKATAAEVMAADKDAPPTPPVEWWGFRGASVDGWVLPEEPWRIYAEGKEASVPLMMGVDVQEIVPGGQSIEQLRHAMAETVGAADAARLEAIYNATPAGSPLGSASARWATDHDFRCATRQVASWHTANGQPVYIYQFDRPLPGNQTALHTTDLFYIFDFFYGEKRPTVEDEQVAGRMGGLITEFVKSSAPASQKEWPPFDASGTGPYLHIPPQGTVFELQRDLAGESCPMIQHAYPK